MNPVSGLDHIPSELGTEFVVRGLIPSEDGMRTCTLVYENGCASIEDGFPDRFDFSAILVEDMVNAHTHCADYGMSVPEGIGIEDLVAPPNGLKHRYLRGLSKEELVYNIESFSIASASSGSSAFIDFREGGAEGCRVLREHSEDAIILGRPLSPKYEQNEVSEILEVADGIGLPSISDMPMSYIESVADDTRRAKKIFSIHASERVRENIDDILSLDPAFIVHMCEGSDSDFAKCAEAEVPIVVCPSSNIFFGKIPPIKRMLDAGADVLLGTDNGMLSAPDMVKEANVYCDVLSRQGGNVNSVWNALSGQSSKILYRVMEICNSLKGRNIAVIPTKENIHCDASFFGEAATFRLRIK